MKGDNKMLCPTSVTATHLFDEATNKEAQSEKITPINTKRTSASSRATTVSAWMCVAACAVTSLVTHKVGCLVRELYLTGPSNADVHSSVRHGSTKPPIFSDLVANQQLERAIRSQQVVKVKASSGVDECATALKEVVLEEVFFPDGFGQQLCEEPCEEPCETEESVDNDEFEVAKDDDDEDDDYDEEFDESESACSVVVKVDLKFVDSEFLSSMEELQRALLSVIWEESASRRLQLWKLQCQTSSFIMCSATLNEGNFLHLSSHPEDGGFIHLSAYVNGDGGDLTNLIARLQKHFSVPASTGHVVRSAWRLQPLGIYKPGLNSLLTDDMFTFSFTPHFIELYKTVVLDEMSKFQRITVTEKFDVPTHSLEAYEASLVPGSSSYAANNPEFFQPTKTLFLDGTSQSTSYCDAGYHEALVHPAMFAHPTGPKRVAIVGGGEGATLREVLKHKSVEKCLMIEIDPDMVRVAREALPEWNDCSDFSESDVNCFDHPRADVRLEDAFAWFRNNFGPSATLHSEDPLDVIIMDALDPEGGAEIVMALYRNEEFWVSIIESLTDDGILIMQMGAAPANEEVGEQFSLWHNRDAFLGVIERVGFRQMFTYVEDHAGFGDSWTFLVACVSDRCKDRWFSSSAQVNLEMHTRVHRRRSDNQVALDFFDGVLVSEYQRPRRQWESVYCKKVPRPVECEFVESQANRLAVGGSAAIRNAGDLRVAAALARAINSTDDLKGVSEFRPLRSHLSSPVVARHFTLLFAQHLSEASD
eukprot:CAMPEP_0194030294 /NCGR_PEP_ID=MMETSP0009_2-20130614/3843_1 /TAXON_ID=210454 /ORGANISM="Grammatophora oceanica, Strain CCMP 410" /LENGTH=761 /DNA_ID=CAMNT_0038670225 /DNA_START=116 /DNA_END=2401 /DNA_ORIENTATION=+